MKALARQRCFHHVSREAAVLCLACSRFYCRECVAEHQGRLLCARCLKQAASAKTQARRGFAILGRIVAFSAGLILAWLVFYACGQGLLLAPASFHEGTFWMEALDGGDDP